MKTSSRIVSCASFLRYNEIMERHWTKEATNQCVAFKKKETQRIPSRQRYLVDRSIGLENFPSSAFNNVTDPWKQPAAINWLHCGGAAILLQDCVIDEIKTHQVQVIRSRQIKHSVWLGHPSHLL